MTAFGAERVDDVVAQCRSASEAIGTAFSVAFGGEFTAYTSEPTQLNSDEFAKNLAGPGLIFRISVGETPCTAVLVEADCLLPEWCIEPDDEAGRKLRQLGRDLLTAMLPPGTDHELMDVTSQRDLAAAWHDEPVASPSVCLPLDVDQGDAVAKLWLVWPATSDVAVPESVGTDGPATGKPSTTPPFGPEPAGKGQLPKHRRLIYRDLEEGIRQLPAYAQSLLRVQVPVTVTLAAAKTPVSKILDMGPGTILQFKKACDSNLTLEVGRQTVAEGEAVKVGDKFGFWITSMMMPSERFWSVNKSATTKRVK